MRTVQYNRTAAVMYAKKWAFSRNRAYYDFSKIGGDCTNFASQCIFAGANQMNFTKDFGWYYKSANERTASWTGVEYLYNFLTTNQGLGPFAKTVPIAEAEIGDIIQLGNQVGDFYHSPVVVGFARGQILLAAHTYDAYNKPLNSYSFATARAIHILGVRKSD